MHDACVRQHAALGQSRCAARIGKERQLIPARNQIRQFILHLKDIPPVVDITMRQARQRMMLCQPCQPLCGDHRRFVQRINDVGELGDDQMLEMIRRLLPIAGRGHLASEVARRDCNRCFRIRDVMAQFFCAVHRIHRDDNRVGAGDRIMGDDKLGAVLHDHQHSITAPNPKRGKPRGKSRGRAF